MALIDWNDNMSVNVVEIDQQHQRLITMINELFDAMTIGQGKAALDSIVNNLIIYSEIHFRTEELYFDRYGYAEAESHKKEHADFIEKVSSFKQGVDSGQ